MIIINFKSKSTIMRGKYDRNTNPWSYENIKLGNSCLSSKKIIHE